MKKGTESWYFGVGTLVLKWENNFDWVYIPSLKLYTNIPVMKYNLTGITVQF